jgi:hypothetical protein
MAFCVNEVVDIGIGDGEEDLCDDAAAATDEVCKGLLLPVAVPSAWFHITILDFYSLCPIADEMQL